MAIVSSSQPRNYYDKPSQFQLAPTPHLINLRTETLSLCSTELKSPTVYLVRVDSRCDDVKIIIRRGYGVVKESIEMILPADFLALRPTLVSELNSWTESHPWVYDEYFRHPLELVFLCEDYVTEENAGRYFDTYVKFSTPDVVVIVEGEVKSHLHELLLPIFPDMFRAELKWEGELVYWFYYDRKKVHISGPMEVAFGYVNISRLDAKIEKAESVAGC